MREKLGKYLARCGVASRRAVAALIEKGFVRVDGRVESNVAARIDPDCQRVSFKGAPVAPEKTLCYVLNKPAGYVCSNRPAKGDRSALELVSAKGARLYTVGRLDKDSEGLILVTNDGSLAHVLTHPRFKVPKTYRVEVSGRIEPEHAERLKEGFWLDGRKTGAAKIRIVHRGRAKSAFEMTITEGHNRQIRRCLARIGLKVRRLKRIRIGRIALGGLKTGRIRALSPGEVEYLRGLRREPLAGAAEKGKQQ